MGEKSRRRNKKKDMRTVRKINREGKEYIEGRNKKIKKKKGRKILKVLFFVFIALCIVGACIVFGVISGIVNKTDVLTDESLTAGKQTTFIYDKDGNQIGALFDEENRISVEYKDIPQSVVNAVTSIEDERFFTHKGVDVKRTGAAIVTYVLNGGKSNFGGSTITQQLVKNLKEDDERSWTRKIREWYRAYELEKIISKEEIFTLYVNTIYFGDGAYGIEVASQNFFGKSIKDVNIAESAILAAQIQSPEATNPYKSDAHKQKLLERQKVVLNKMLELQKITQEEYNQAMSYEIAFKKEVVSITSEVQSYFVDAVVEAVIEDLQEQNGWNRGVAIQKLYGSGYKIYTTMDQKVQKAVDEAYNNPQLFYANSDGSFMQSAMVVIEQSTGNVVGLIGGAGEKKGALELNRATQIKKQPGSCMKPLGAYGPAMEQGLLSPGSGLDDAQLENIATWDPHNYYDGFYGYVTARDAVAQSMNLPAIRACRKVDISYAYNFAKNMGLKSLVEKDKNLASMSLGGLTNGVSVLEMANAYATIANKGVYIEPKLYTKVVDQNEKEILLNTKSTAKVVMKESTAYMLTSCLEQVVKSGTGYGYIKVPNMAVAGKTGNTNDDFDQWFCGYSPYYTIACWNGYDENRTIGNRKIGRYPYTSVKLFNTVMNSISQGLTPASFEQPNSVTSAALCKVSGLVATDACRKDQRGDQTKTDFVDKNAIPTDTCNIHKMVTVCDVTGKIANEYCSKKSEKSFITRDFEPQIKPADWSNMLPKETCTEHTAETKKKEEAEKEKDNEKNEVDIYDDKSFVGDTVTSIKDKINDVINKKD